MVTRPKSSYRGCGTACKNSSRRRPARSSAGTKVIRDRADSQPTPHTGRTTSTSRSFRATQGNAAWHKPPLAFYELLQPDSIKPDGKKRSFITWRNYKPYGPTLTGPKPKPPEPPPAPRPNAEEPEEPEEPQEDESPKPGKAKERPAAGDRGFRIM